MMYKNKLKKRIADFKKYSDYLGVSFISVVFDYFFAFLFYGFSIMDYLEVSDGYKLSNYEKKRFLTHKRMQKILSQVNTDFNYNNILIKKSETLKYFSEFVKRSWIYPKESSIEAFIAFARNNRMVIVKPIDEMCGRGIYKRDYICMTDDDIMLEYEKLKNGDFIVEECIVNHHELNLNNKSLNTIRIFSMLDSAGVVHILKAKFRAGVGNSIVDAASGSVHYPISVDYGIIEGPGLVLDYINDKFYYSHPGSDKIIVGIKIPFWKEIIQMITEAALKMKKVRLIGWDVAVTENGPELIEANHNPYHGTFEEIGVEKLWYNKLKKLI